MSKRAESITRISEALDAFIAELLESTRSSTLPSTAMSTEASVPVSARVGTAAPLVDEAARKLKQGSITQVEFHTQLKQITTRCGDRLSITPLDTSRNVFHIHPTGSSNAEVSTQDINEVLAWLRRQDLLGE